jgi:hypothetical protein
MPRHKHKRLNPGVTTLLQVAENEARHTAPRTPCIPEPRIVYAPVPDDERGPRLRRERPLVPAVKPLTWTDALEKYSPLQSPPGK